MPIGSCVFVSQHALEQSEARQQIGVSDKGEKMGWKVSRFKCREWELSVEIFPLEAGVHVGALFYI